MKKATKIILMLCFIFAVASMSYARNVARIENEKKEGMVTVDVATDTGVNADNLSVLTPNSLQIYIPAMGDYTVTITLSNGEVFCCEFTITN